MNNTDKYKRDFARVLTLLMLLAALFVTDIPVSADTTDSATVSSISAVTEKAEIKASSNTALKISWEKCPLAQEYVIYRRESTRKAFRRIKKVSASRTSYIDKRLTSSKPYQYAVRAISYGNRCYTSCNREDNDQGSFQFNDESDMEEELESRWLPYLQKTCCRKMGSGC